MTTKHQKAELQVNQKLASGISYETWLKELEARLKKEVSK